MEKDVEVVVVYFEVVSRILLGMTEEKLDNHQSE
jgi:hypothetical protein